MNLNYGLTETGIGVPADVGFFYPVAMTFEQSVHKLHQVGIRHHSLQILTRGISKDYFTWLP